MTYLSSDAEARLGVVEAALSLAEGCSMRCPCPKCGFGQAFSMSRVGSEIRFICFSNSCGFHGVITSKGGDAASIEQKGIRQSKLFTGTLTALEYDEIDYLVEKFRIEPEWLSHTRYSEEDNRVYFPQYDVMGRVFGYIARHYPALNQGRATKGAKAYWKQCIPGDPGLLFPNMDVRAQVVNEKRAVLVEDYPSMLRINSQLGAPCCCLGGTSIYAAHIDTLLMLGVTDLVILLDADAVVKAIKLKRSLALAFDSVTVVPLTGADPKDMSHEELDVIGEAIHASRVN